jgi:hypothetical protein
VIEIKGCSVKLKLGRTFAIALHMWNSREAAVSTSSKQEEARRPEDETVEAILRYLEEHPRASDTLEGIAEWWIMRHQVRVEVNTLMKILRQLTERELLEKTGVGETARYRLKAKGNSLPS